MGNILDRFLPWTIIFVSFVIIASVNILRPADTFFSGDGGLKTLQIKQLRQGASGIRIQRPVPSWVKKVWEQGRFPFGPPFVWKRDGVRYSAFPVYFPVINIPFHAALGFRGLFLIPMITLLILWIRFTGLLRRNIQSRSAKISALLVLIPAAPLTLYGVIFWEHAPAVFLTYFGFEFMIHILGSDSPPDGTPSGKRALIAGLLAGAAPWLRPETIVFNGALALVLIVFTPAAKRRSLLIFLVSMAAVTSGFFLANVLVYGTPLGIHSMEVAGQLAGRGRIALGILGHMSRELIAYYSVVLIPLFYAPYIFLRKRDARVFPIMLVGILFLVGVCLILPNGGARQWGPRYLLPLIPLVAYIIALIITDAREEGAGKLRRYLVPVLLGITLLHTLAINGIVGPRVLLKDYRTRVSPLLEQVRGSAEKYIIVDHQWTALELAVFFRERIFLLVEKEKDLAPLLATMNANGANEFLYLSRRCSAAVKRVPGYGGRILKVDFRDVKTLGGYGFCRGKLIQ